ncbi:hypothetical protein [Streptomyces sp. NBC_00316]|uniref:hypothetical protein n=1 Tax=Streptomyces sp. NBC_00316 TaxID=2975710 RepID=UPI002E287BD3|nr:hypothetical protein [Streptomyces sp. NBC_00316]
MRKLQKVAITVAAVGGLVALGAGSSYAADYSDPPCGRTQPRPAIGLLDDMAPQAPQPAVNQANQAVGNAGRTIQVNQAIGNTGKTNQANQAVGNTGKTIQVNQAIRNTGKTNQANQAVGNTGKTIQVNQAIRNTIALGFLLTPAP